MSYNYVKNILNDLKRRFKDTNLPYEFELTRELLYLSEYEKMYIKNNILPLPFDFGTLNTLKLLTKANILTLTEYLENISDKEEVTKILIELIDDSEESYMLIEDILSSNKFTDEFNECLKFYVNDVILQPELIRNELVIATKGKLPKELFRNTILLPFIDHLFHHHLHNPVELTEILSCQKKWNEEFKKNKLLLKILQSIMKLEVAVKEVLNVLQKGNDFNWYFLLMSMNFITEDSSIYTEIKKFINNQFRVFSANSNATRCLHTSLILARQLYHYQKSSKKSSYQNWVKNNIGDLNYILKDKTVFSSLIESLENIITYENDTEIINIHIKVQISAPSKEYSHCLEYKQMLRSRESALSEDVQLIEIE